MNFFDKKLSIALVALSCMLPFMLNQFGISFSSVSQNINYSSINLSQAANQNQLEIVTAVVHHAILEWSAVVLALIAGAISFVHYNRYKDVSVPIIGLALLCAGFTDAFHTLAATRIISADVTNSGIVPFTWASSRVFNASMIILAVLVSLWLTRSARKKMPLSDEAAVRTSNFKTLVLVGLSFTSLATVLVRYASTTEDIPQIIYANALITRPYDILPLALFVFSGTLIYGWYKKKETIFKFSLLLSLIPEIATQIHMSIGSTTLFDNHFNIAHLLKILAYAILTIGVTMSLYSKNKKTEGGHNHNEETANEFDNSQLDRRVPKSLKKDLLEVGSAKYPQVFLISSFTFLLSIAITILVTSVFYVDSARLAKEEKLQQLSIEADFIEPLIKEIYHRTEDDIHFLAKVPAIQAIITALKEKDTESEKIWLSRLKTIFAQFIRNDEDYSQIRFIKLSTSLEVYDDIKTNTNKELIRSYRINQNVYSVPNSKLEKIEAKELLDHESAIRGQVTFYNSSLTTIDHLKNDSILNLVMPIFDDVSGENFGIISIELNFSHFIDRLELASLAGRNIYIADKHGEIIYREDSELDTQFQLSADQELQSIFPQLSTAVNMKLERYQLGLTQSHQQNQTKAEIIYGHFRAMHLQPSDNDDVMLLFIRMDKEGLESRQQAFRFRSLVLGFGLSIISLTLAILVSRKLSGSLKQTTQALVQFGYTGKIDDLPTEANDETGVLARSFHNLLVAKAAQDKEILQQKRALDEHAIVSITDVRGDIQYVNDKFMAISGFSRNELLGQNHRILNSGYHDTEFFKEMYRSVANGKPWNAEICNKAKDGHYYWVHTTIIPFMGNDGKPESYISIRTDISNIKKIEMEIKESRDALSSQVLQLEEANADLDQFAYVASHDLKSPLNGISQLISWIDDDCRELVPEESKEHLDLLKSRSKRMMALLNDLLDYSRIGRDKHDLETVNLSNMVNDIFELQGNREGFSCTGPDIDIKIQRIPFEMVLRNLISNAIKHHHKTEGKIEVEYQEIVENGRCFHQFTVKDDGPGIPENLQEKAMEMFQTLQSRDKVEGSGMGLAMARKMAERNKGSLTIVSDGRQGSAFIVKWAA